MSLWDSLLQLTMLFDKKHLCVVRWLRGYKNHLIRCQTNQGCTIFTVVLMSLCALYAIYIVLRWGGQMSSFCHCMFSSHGAALTVTCFCLVVSVNECWSGSVSIFVPNAGAHRVRQMGRSGQSQRESAKGEGAYYWAASVSNSFITHVGRDGEGIFDTFLLL